MVHIQLPSGGGGASSSGGSPVVDNGDGTAVGTASPVQVTDADVAAQVTNGLATAAALKAAYAPRLRPLTAVALGHSNVVRDSTAGPQRAQGSWYTYLCGLSGQRLRYVRNLGVTGDTSAMILARVGQVIALAPAVCLIQCFGNDITGGVAPATTKANTIAIWNALLGAGITPIHVTDFPKAGANGTATNALNAWATAYGQRHGVLVLDAHSAVVNSATNAIAAAYDSGDGVHLNAQGDWAAAQALNAQLSGLVSTPPYMASAIGDSLDLIGGYGTFAADTNADGIADGWTLIGSGTASYSLAGGYQVITRPTGSTGTRYLSRTISTGWAPGDVIAVSGLYQISGDTFTGGGSSLSVGLDTNSATKTNQIMGLNSNKTGSGAFYMEGTVSADTTALTALVTALPPGTSAGDVTFRVGRFTAVNLTQNSLLA